MAGTRPGERTLAQSRNNAEKTYQVAVSAARVTLKHDRAQAEIDDVAAEVDWDIAEAQATFDAREALTAPESIGYSQGFAEAFPSRPQ